MELQDCINFLLTIAQHNVFQYLSQKLAPYDITPSQYGVLNCLWGRDYNTPKQIADTLCLETSTISGVLDRMQTKGLIDRIVNVEDRREVQVIATVLKIIEEVNIEALKDLNSEQQEQLKTYLRIIANGDFK